MSGDFGAQASGPESTFAQQAMLMIGELDFTTEETLTRVIAGQTAKSPKC